MIDVVSGTEQLMTFRVGSDLFGISVLRVQEVAGRPALHAVPLAPKFVRGLVNLRGQIATALGLQELFGAEARGAAESDDTESMSVVCKIDGNLVSLIVDSIGDVVEVESSRFEPTPPSVREAVRRFVKGIYKMDGDLLSVVDLDRLSKELSPGSDSDIPSELSKQV